MRRRVGAEEQPAAAELDRGAVRADGAGRHDHRADALRAEDLGEALAVEVAADREFVREPGVADELRAVVEEGAGAEGVVRVDVADDDVADRAVGAGPDLGPEPGAVGEAAARVGDEDRVAADDEADVGDAAEIAGGRLLVGPTADEDAGGDLVDGLRAVGEAGQAAEAGGTEQGVAAGRCERAGLRRHLGSRDRVAGRGAAVNSAVGMISASHLGSRCRLTGRASARSSELRSLPARSGDRNRTVEQADHRAPELRRRHVEPLQRPPCGDVGQRHHEPDRGFRSPGAHRLADQRLHAGLDLRRNASSSGTRSRSWAAIPSQTAARS